MLLHEAPWPFGPQNTSRLCMLSLAATRNLLFLHDPPTATKNIHGYRPWLQPRTTYPLQSRTRSSLVSLVPRRVDSAFAIVPGLRSHRCNRVGSDCLTTSFVWITLAGDWRPASLSAYCYAISGHTPSCKSIVSGLRTQSKGFRPFLTFPFHTGRHYSGPAGHGCHRLPERATCSRLDSNQRPIA